MPELYAGVDGGKTEHHCHVMTAEGTKMLSRRVGNDEAALLELLGEVTALANGGPVTWAVDLNAGGAALLITVLFNHAQQVVYLPGRTVYHAASTYRGSGKTDAKDAAIIADQARMRHDLKPLQPADDISVDLKILTSHRADLSADRTRHINRLRAQLLEYFPALERAFDYNTSKAALTLLSGYQTPDTIRRTGQKRLETWLRKRHVRGAAMVAATAVKAAQAQYTTLPGQTVAADMLARLAQGVMTPDAEVAETRYTAFAGTPHQCTARLVVRRVKDKNSEDALFPVWRYHAFFTDTDYSTVDADLTHRQHAVIETVFADLIDGPLAHLPSGHFDANAAWAAIAAISHNLLRAAGSLTSVFHAKARGATLRRQLICVPGRLAQPQGRATLHLPEHWPWATEFATLHTRANSPPAA